MFKKMKLATKMALGFGVLVLLSGVLGAVSWRGLSQIVEQRARYEKGAATQDRMNTCAIFRRDFGVRGFQKAEGETKNAAEKWQEAYGELAGAVKTLDSDKGLTAEQRELATKTTGDVQAYKVAFDKMADAKKVCDQALASWRSTGYKMTEEIVNVMKTTIDPAIVKAKADKKFEDMDKWSTIASSLDRSFIQPFLLMRVCGMHLTATEAEQQWVDYAAQLKNVQEGLAKWTALVRSDGQLETVAKNLAAMIQEYEAAGVSFHNGLLGKEEASKVAADVAKNVAANITRFGVIQNQEMEAVTARTNTLVMSMAFGSLVIGILLAVFITRSIVKPIMRIVGELNEGAVQVNDAAGQVSCASQSLAEGASEQASSLEETSSALEEMAAMTRTSAENAKKANELAGKAREAANTGDATMGRLNSAMTGINESSEKVSKIIKVIEEIAFQTNLLALNAAVEAARAGEHGKGFAVVADEVRNLAQRSAQAAKETTELIENAVIRSHEGTQVAGDVGKALSAIVSDVGKVTELINGISRASEEQAQGVDQVNTAVSQMDKVTQQNASTAEESASASEELSAQAQTVKGIVNELSALITGQQAGNTGLVNTSPIHRSVSKAATKPRTAPTVASPARSGKGSDSVSIDTTPSLAAEDLKEF